MEKSYYLVEAKCGHVGRRNFIRIVFPVIAENGKSAAEVVRNFPRVKHNHEDAILSVKKVSFNEFIFQKQMNDDDMYLKCKSIQDQNIYCLNLEERIETDKYDCKQEFTDYFETKIKRNERYLYRVKKQELRYSVCN